MSQKSRHINTRFDEATHQKILNKSRELGMKKSDFVRQAIKEKLDDDGRGGANILSQDERDKVIEKLGLMMSDLSKIEQQNKRLGNNINQIARGLNQGNVPKSEFSVEEYKEYGKVFEQVLPLMSDALNRLWLELYR